MIRARFRLWLPDGLWVADVSRSFPDASLRLLTGVPMDDRTLELGETRGEDPRAVVEAIRKQPDVRSLELLYCDEERSLSRYETEDQALFEFLGGSSLLPEFPLVVEDGVMSFAITASRADFEAFGDRLDASGLRYELQSVVHRDDSDGGPLTDRQLECLTVAWRMGYFEVPRDCSLAEVADALDVDTSTVSETIRRGTARVLERFLFERERSSNR
ncbi:helix-turn-helix domain-containing protein [Haloglomus litoreum]|uniref:helix-turn-helix domain-containing protein n=1 Tax=Haloglomus litoreum TaxID=3034026 RepID=UPI0023E7FD0C|nr:helix-turn-helix domain-containing protein [Haloglomus sp. DT116]